MAGLGRARGWGGADWPRRKMRPQRTEEGRARVERNWLRVAYFHGKAIYEHIRQYSRLNCCGTIRSITITFDLDEERNT